MGIDLLALAILAIYLGLGVWRGVLASASGLISLVAGYWVAFTLGPLLGPVLAVRLGAPEMIGLALAGSGAFGVTWITSSTIFRVLRRISERRRAGRPRSGIDRLGGALFGFARGALIVVLLGWMSLWLEAARGVSAEGGNAAETKRPESRLAAVSGAVVEKALGAALSDAGPSGQVMARLAARPDQTLGSMRRLMEDERVRAVQDDAMFWTYVQNDSVESALNRGSFWKIVHDTELRAQFAELGVISEQAASDPQAFREDAGRVLEQIGPRIKGLKDDPEIQRLAQDPEIVALLESGNTFALLTHPDIRRVVSRVSAGLGTQSDL